MAGGLERNSSHAPGKILRVLVARKHQNKFQNGTRVADELLLKHAINKAGGLPGMYDDLVQFFAPRSAEDGTALLIMAKYEDVFLDSQYANGSDGEMYKLELIYYPTTSFAAFA